MEEQEITKIDIKEFRKLGFLQEVNRLFFHPRGLALEVKIDDNGNESLGGVWDYRDDPEGMIFGGEINQEKVENVKKIYKEKALNRQKELGYVIQK